MMSRHARPDADAPPLFLSQLDTVKLPRKRSTRLTRRPAFVGVASALCLLAGGAVTGTLHTAGSAPSGAAATSSSVASAVAVHPVSIMVDGQVQQVHTAATTVRGTLAATGLAVGAHDTVAPGLDAAVAADSVIVVERGRPFAVTLDGTTRHLWTTARTVNLALAQAGLAGQASVRWSADASAVIPTTGLAVSGQTMHTVSWTVGGKPAITAPTTADTVRALLAEHHVVLGPLDKVSPALSTRLQTGMQVVVTRVSVATSVANAPVDQPADVKVSDAKLNRGTTKVVSPGSEGFERVVYKVVSVNGRVATRSELGRATVVPAVAPVVKVGTKAPDPTSQQSADEAAAGFTYVGDEVFTNDTTFGVNWDGLAILRVNPQPEGGQRQPVRRPADLRHVPVRHPDLGVRGRQRQSDGRRPAEQLMRAKLLYQQRGLEPWACADAAHAPAPDGP